MSTILEEHGAFIESEKKYRLLEENIPGMVYLFAMHPDGSSSFPHVSAASRELFGIAPQDLMHDATLIMKLIHPDDRERFEQSVKQSIETLQPWREELRHIVNGEVRWYDCSSRPELQPNGDIVWIGVVLEITQRKLAEEELKCFRFSIEKAKDAVFWLDHTARFSYVNEQACRSLGYTREELMRLYLWDIDPDFPEELWGNVWEEDAKLGHRMLETSHRRKNGSFFPVEVLSNHIKFGANDFHVAFVRDISERKRAEEALRANEEKFRSVVDNIKMSVVLIDTDMKILSANQYAKEFFPDIEFEKHPKCYEAFNSPPRKEPCGFCATIESIQDGEVHETIRETPSRNGIRNFRVISTPIKDSGGKVTSVIEIAEDITDKKRIEDEKRKLEEQLIQVQKMEALGTMAGGIAHDFNNILSIIFCYTEMVLIDIPEGGNMRRRLTQVLNASSRAKDLVKQILSFSRKGSLEPQPISPHIIIKETLKLLRATIPSSIEIQQRSVTPCGTILADPTQFHQILMNLVMNAVHAMHETGILRISLKRASFDEQDLAHRPDMVAGPYVQLSVSDTGIGMSPEVIEHVFEPFFTTKDVGKGTGMGLSVVHGIVLAHKGLIKVYSEPGKGTTFHVYFPIAESEAVYLAESVVPLPVGTERILFVDDEPELATLGQNILENLGYKVTVTTSSVDALEIFHSRPDAFDLVITDQTMPKMSGLELIQELLNINPAVPIILCTGYSSKISLDHTNECTFQELLMKPLTRKKLATAVRRVIDGR